jgi:hypothetical protein
MKKITENLENVCGVYKIVNLVNNKFYIGSTKNIRERLWKHRALLRHNRHHNPHLQNSWNKYGEDNFDYCILEVCTSENQYEREQFYIDTFHPEYNIAEIVELPSYSEVSRKKHSETRKRMFAEGKLIPTKMTKIYMYDLSGNFIKEYQSLVEASRELNINRHLIGKNLSGEQKRCHEYIFKYEYSPSIPPYIKAPKDNSYTWKTVHVYNEEEEYFFKNAQECCEFFGVCLVYIRDAIKHHRHFKRKYTIEYTTARL